MDKIEPGQAVPDFELPATGGGNIRLSALQGNHVVLYFYPKDSTPGCTREGQDFAVHHPEFRRLNTVVLGISRDGIKSHENFKTSQDFPFELLSDQAEELCLRFGVIKLKNMYGKKVRGIERSTFLIDRRSRLRREWRKIKVEGHVEQVLEAVREL